MQFFGNQQWYLRVQNLYMVAYDNIKLSLIDIYKLKVTIFFGDKTPLNYPFLIDVM